MGDKPDSYTGIGLCVMTTSAEDHRIPQIKDGEHGPTYKDYTKTAEWEIIKINPAMYLKSAGRLIGLRRLQTPSESALEI